MTETDKEGRIRYCNNTAVVLSSNTASIEGCGRSGCFCSSAAIYPRRVIAAFWRPTRRDCRGASSSAALQSEHRGRQHPSPNKFSSGGRGPDPLSQSPTLNRLVPDIPECCLHLRLLIILQRMQWLRLAQHRGRNAWGNLLTAGMQPCVYMYLPARIHLVNFYSCAAS